MQYLSNLLGTTCFLPSQYIFMVKPSSLWLNPHVWCLKPPWNHGALSCRKPSTGTWRSLRNWQILAMRGPHFWPTRTRVRNKPLVWGRGRPGQVLSMGSQHRLRRKLHVLCPVGWLRGSPPLKNQWVHDDKCIQMYLVFLFFPPKHIVYSNLGRGQIRHCTKQMGLWETKTTKISCTAHAHRQNSFWSIWSI